MKSDRVFGLVVILGALAYIAGAFQIQTSFMADPVGSKTFPIILGVVAILCGLVMLVRPDEEPDWPDTKTLVNIAIAALVMVAYAYTLKPGGFLIPTAICAAVLSYQISPRAVPAALTGVGLSIGLFFIFKFVLGLGLSPLPKALMG
ncbi:tripartite tricarboxylate transporter TctB family protein [Tropicibacter oceani]|uniref:Tripartite tricarboxylate transporter TctB family protein n=1 Tax=Tropicibacter oceani TaxID=3058420 RepID=A0ABY8QG60_9RHOB|nr:tripartite tricarboxylate transporter TctB family protein [Tropicibacter oceani]WGW03604.1 tripartite tricarboxylate transporter TctB family protein [Tropicibacter oceani]